MTATVIKDLREVESLPDEVLKKRIFFLDTNAILHHPEPCLDIIKETEMGKTHFRISDVVLQELIFIVDHGLHYKGSGIDFRKVDKIINEIKSRHKNSIIHENPTIVINILEHLHDLTSKKVAYDIVIVKGEEIISQLRNPRVNIKKLAELIEGSAFRHFKSFMLERLNRRLDVNHFKEHIRQSKNNLINSINFILNFIYREIRMSQGQMGDKKILNEIKNKFDKSLKNDIRIAAHFLVYEHSGKAMLSMDKDVRELIDLYEIWQMSHS